MSIQPGYYSRLDRMNGLGEPLTAEEEQVTFPGGWFVLAVLFAVAAIWVSQLLLVFLACLVLGIAAVWKEKHREVR
jgi:hypothetical protein